MAPTSSCSSISGGPTLTLGHLQKNFFDYTQLTITGGGTLRQGLSPFSFDRAVDLSTVGVGLTQQLAGPLLLSGGLGFNVDPNSGLLRRRGGFLCGAALAAEGL